MPGWFQRFQCALFGHRPEGDDPSRGGLGWNDQLDVKPKVCRRCWAVCWVLEKR